MEEQPLEFEEAFTELETVVSKLEAGDLPLEESLALFERGMFLAQYCEKRLDRAELRVQELVADDDGEAVIRPFESAE